MLVTGLSFVAIFTVFALSSVLYLFDYPEYARYSSLVGFGALFVISIVLTVYFALSGIFHVWFFGVNMGVLLMFNAFVRIWYKEPISPKLTKTMTAFIGVIMPFYTVNGLQPLLQEFMANQFYTYFLLLGVDVSLVYQEPGLLTRLVFSNGGYLFVYWACVGFEFAALYSAIVLVSDGSVKDKIAWIGTSVILVYLLNVLRVLFTGTVMAHNLLGPLVTTENTIQMSYFLAERVISQILIVVAATAYFIMLSKTVPGIREIIDGFLDLHPKHERYLKNKLN